MGQEADILTEDWSRKTLEYDGLIYTMHRRGSDGSLVPLYRRWRLPDAVGCPD
jgi:hypothetical protein